MIAIRNPRWLLSLLLGLPIVALIALVVAASPRSGPARAKLLAHAQAPQEQTQEAPEAPAEEGPEATIFFNFRNAPWSQVLDRFSQLAGLSLVMEVAPPGTFSYFDDRPYTVTAALDLVNRVLLAKGFLLIRKQDLLILVTTDKPIPTSLISVIEVAELAKLADNELVTLSIPLQFLAADSLVTEIEPLLSTFGKTASLPRTKRVLITDLVVNLRKIHPLVVELDNSSRPKPPSPPSQPAPPKVEKILAVEHLDVTTLAETLRKFYSGRAEVEPFGPKTLLVQATADVQQKVAELVLQIDIPPAPQEPAVEAVFPLKHLSAAGFSRSLQTLFPTATRNARFTADAANNSVIVIAPKTVNESVASLIGELDRPPANQPIPKSYVPKHVSLDPLLSALKTMFGNNQVRFTTDPLRRRIVVTASPEVHAKIAAMVEELDQPTDDGGVHREHVYRLKHAKAATLAAMLGTLYPAATSNARFSSGGADDLLIVVASETLQASVRRILDEVDRPAGVATVERTYTPKHVRSQALLATLQSLYGNQPSTRFTVDPQERTIIISAPEETQQKIQAMLTQLDQPQDPERTPVQRFYKLENATGSTLLSPLQTLFPETIYRARFSFDGANNALIVSASESVQKEIEGAIRQMDQPPASARRVDRVYELRRANPQTVLSSLQTLYGPQASFVLNAANRAIIVSASEPVQQKIAAIVEQLDKAPDDDAQAVQRIHRLRFQALSLLSSALQALYQDRPDVRILPDSTNNSLLVVAPENVQKAIAELILDADRPTATTTVERTYTPKHVRPETLLATLQNLYGNQPSTRFTVDPRGRTLIIAAPPETQQKIEAMLAQLDQPQDPERTPVSRFYKLEHATGSALISPLQTLFPESTHRARFSHDVANNALIVFAPAALQQEIEGVIQKMDQPPASARRVERVYKLRRADPQAVLSSLQTLYGTQASFVVDAANRTIIASALEQLQAKISSLVEQFDKPPSDEGPPVEYRVYALRFATPDALATALNTVFENHRSVRILSDATNRSLVVVAPAEVQTIIGAMIKDADQDNQSSRVQEKVYALSHVATPTLLDTLRTLYGSGEGIRITAGPRNQSIIVVGPSSVHRKVEAMLAQFDQTEDSTRASLSRGYPLSNARAESVAAALEAQFGSMSGVSITADRNNNAVIVKAPPGIQLEIAGVIRQVDEPAASSLRTDQVYQLEHADTRAILSSLQTLYGAQARFIEDSARRLIIANATEPIQEKIAQLIQQFDTPLAEGGARRHHVYRLRFANTSALGSALQSLYSNRGDVRIVADPPNRSLVVVAPDSVHEAVAAMVADTDKNPRGTDLIEQLYRPRYLAASSLLATLSNLYAPPNGRARFSIDQRGEAVIAVAGAEEQKRIAATVEVLDQPPDPASRRVAKAYPLKNARPESVAAAIGSVYPPGRRVQVMPVTESSTITVLATREEHERIAELIGDLDNSGRSVANMTQRTYRLQFATPGSLVAALQSLYQNRRDVRIVPDAQNRSLLVVAPEELQKDIAQLILETDQEAQGSARVEKVFRPKHVTAASLVPTLSSLYAPPNGNARFSLHGNGQTVVIVAPAAQHERIAATLELLDQADDPETRPVPKVYRLVNTSRDSVVSVLRAVYAGNSRVQVTGGVDPLAVTVVASNVEQERIAALVEDMDQPAEPGAERTVEVIDLVEINPFTAASTIRNLYRALPQPQMPFVESDFDPDRLVIRATAQQIAEIKHLLVQMGEDPALVLAPGGQGRTVRTIRVRQGSPRTVAVAIEKLWPRLRRNPLQVIVPAAIARSSPSGQETPIPPLPEREPGRLQKPKGQLLPGDPDKPVVLTVTGSNLIAASDDADALTLVERLARSLTKIPDPDQGDFTVFYLDTANAVTVTETLDRAFNGPLPQQGRRQTRDERVRVVANEEANAVIVRAAPADLVGVQEMIESLDSGGLALLAAGDVHIVPLKQATASDVAEILHNVYHDYITSDSQGPARTRGFSARRARRGGGPLVTISIGVDVRSNSLVISAPDDLFEQMETLINGLEAAATGATRRYRVTPLDRANSLDVREALEILLQRDRGAVPRSRSGGNRRRRQRKPNRSRRPRSSITVPDSAAVTRNEGQKKTTGTSVATIRMEAGYVEVSENGFRDSNVSQANRPSSLALASFEEPVTPEGQLSEEPRVDESVTEGRLSDMAEVDALPDLNVILLWGTERDLEILGEVVEQIERLAEDRRLTFRLIPLDYVKASQMADLVDDLYTGIVNSRGAMTRTEEEARAIPLAKPNAILLVAPKNDLDRLVALIHELDQPVSPSTQFRVFRLAHAAVDDLSDVVRDFFSGRSADGELALEMVITPDPRSNSLVVMASPRDMAEVVRLVGDLDVETTASVNQLKVFRLENTEATQLSNVLQQAILGTGGPAAESIMLRLLRSDEQSGRFVESGILENVRITANPGANTLVVSAPSRTMGLLAELIKELDVLPSTAVEIKVFTLQHSDAQRMGETLQTLFTQVEAFGGQIVPVQEELAEVALSSSSPLVQLSFSVDTRTNSLLVSGSPSQLEVVEAIIFRLDGSDAQERITAVYRLKNATADGVATALSTFLERQLLQRLQQTGIVSPTEILERDVVVVPEPVTNSLLISAAPRFFSELKGLIEQLDEAPAQVLIQVLIAQVTLTDDEEFGLELGIQDSVLFQRGIFPGTATLAAPFLTPGISISSNQTPGVPGFNFNNEPLGNNPFASPGNLGAQALSHFGVGRVGTNGFGGLVLSASSESISIMLRALKAQARIDVLSRPQIITLDNQEAFIQVGQKVPVVTSSVITGQGAVINPVNFQDVGIILLVTPKINPDGTIVMRVAPEISSLSASRVEVSSGVFAPIIETTRAETTISAMDGQTVIIGGLITDTKSSTHRRVPFLGEIPILEWAFRFDQENFKKQELLILMTPHVIRSPKDAERIKLMEIERLDWIEEDVEAVHGSVYGIPVGKSSELPEGESLQPGAQPEPQNGEAAPYPSGVETAPGDPVSISVPSATEQDAPRLLPARAVDVSAKGEEIPERREKKEGRAWKLFRRGKD